jgi:hypothetical protein
MGGGYKHNSKNYTKSRSAAQKESLVVANAIRTSHGDMKQYGKFIQCVVCQLTVSFMPFSCRKPVTESTSFTALLYPTPTPLPLASLHTKGLMHRIASLRHQCTASRSHADRFQARSDLFRKKLHNSAKQVRNAKTSQARARDELREAKNELQAAKERLAAQLTKHEKALATVAAREAVRLRRVKSKLAGARWKAEKYRRCSVSIQRKIEKLVGAVRTHSLLNKGAYTSSARRLMRELACISCSASKIATIMHLCADSYGIELVGKPDPRTVGRAVLEGWFASQIQLGKEIIDADGKLLRHLETHGRTLTRPHVKPSPSAQMGQQIVLSTMNHASSQ